MDAPARPTRLTLLLSLFFVAAACGGDGGTDPDPPDLFNVLDVADAVDGLVAPLQPTVEPSVSLRSAFTSLTQQGMTFDREPSPLVERARELTGLDAIGVARSVEFPPEMVGETFVYDTGQQDWVIDPARTGAPPEGVRVIWYSTDQAGNFTLPLDERGYIDLTDEDVGMLNQLGVRIVEVGDTADQVLADFSQGYWTQGDVEWSEHFEADGFYDNGAARTTFDLTSDASGSDATGDQTFSFDIDLIGPTASYTMGLVGSDDGATGSSEENYDFTVLLGSATTRMDLDLTIPANSSQQGSGTLSHQNVMVADITVSGTSFQYTPVGGGSYSSGQRNQIDVLVQTLLLDGFIVLLNLPLLFL